MNGKKLLAILLIAVMCLSNSALIFTSLADGESASGTVVERGSEWEYVVYEDTQAAAPEGWTTKTDSAEWQTGTACFNGGGTSMPYGLFRSYIRQEFTLSNEIADATLYIKYDEQPVVYINGVEVWDWTDYDAGKNYYDHMYVAVSLVDYVSAFKTGTNVIAVDWRNEFGGSCMDLQLDVVAAGEKVDSNGNVIVTNTESYNSAGAPATNPFGDIGKVGNLYDGDTGSVWGWGEKGIYVIANFVGEVNVKSIFLQTKNEGSMFDKTEAHGIYKIEAMVDGEWVVVDETVSAFIEGNYVSTDITTNRIKITVADWYNNNWCSIAELNFSVNECESTEPDEQPEETLTPDVDGTVGLNVFPAFGGWENWAGSPNKGEYVAATQLLVGVKNLDDSVIAGITDRSIEWTITLSWLENDEVQSKTIKLSPATTYGEDVLRFETVLGEGDNQFVPVKGQKYTVALSATVGETTYAGTSGEYAFNCPMGPIVPGAYGFEATPVSVKGYNYDSFGGINAPTNVFDGDLNSVWGSGYRAEDKLNLVADYGSACTFNSLYIACKNEGVPEGAVAEEFVFGTYTIEILVNGEWTTLATGVEARIGGVTLDETFTASAVKVTIDEWFGGAWACIAELKLDGKKIKVEAYDADGYNYDNFGGVNAPTNIFDGDLNSVWGSGYRAEDKLNIVPKYAKEFQFNKIYLACKNEGVPEGVNAAEFTFGLYTVEAFVNGDWVVVADDVPALCNGITVDVDVVTTMFRITIKEWYGGAWACVAEYAAFGKDVPKTIEIGKYGTGWENWSDQTQLLITAPFDSSVENSTSFVWEITIGGTTITLTPSSCYDFGNGSAIWRFETCLAEGDNQFIPVAGTSYEISVKIYDGEELVYVGTAGEGTTWDVPADFVPVLPAPEFGFITTEDGTMYMYEDGTFAKNFTTIEGKTYYFGKDGILFEGESIAVGVYTYWFDAEHAVREGLIAEDGGYRYYKAGVRQYGWVDIDANGTRDMYFYVSSQLRCEEDRVLFDGKDTRRFFKYNAETGCMEVVSGFYTNENGTQFFKNGLGQYGWITADGVSITDRPGITLSNVHYFAYGDGINFYMVEDAVKTIGGVVREFDENHLAKAYTGWSLNKVTGSSQYYIDGVMQQGWVETEDGWIYLSRSQKLEEGIDYGDAFYGWKKIGGKVYYFRAGTSTPAFTLITDESRALTYDGVRDVYYINQPADAATATGADYFITNPPAGF